MTTTTKEVSILIESLLSTLVVVVVARDVLFVPLLSPHSELPILSCGVSLSSDRRQLLISMKGVHLYASDY